MTGSVHITIHVTVIVQIWRHIHAHLVELRLGLLAAVHVHRGFAGVRVGVCVGVGSEPVCAREVVPCFVMAFEEVVQYDCDFAVDHCVNTVIGHS